MLNVIQPFQCQFPYCFWLCRKISKFNATMVLLLCNHVSFALFKRETQKEMEVGVCVIWGDGKACFLGLILADVMRCGKEWKVRGGGGIVTGEIKVGRRQWFHLFYVPHSLPLLNGPTRDRRIYSVSSILWLGRAGKSSFLPFFSDLDLSLIL